MQFSPCLARRLRLLIAASAFLLFFSTLVAAPAPPAPSDVLEVSGTITDDDDFPLIGASVIIKGTTTGTVTDLDGRFSLGNVGAQDTLVISYTGYTTRTVAINGRTTVNVVLSADSQILDEVVVTGYGKQKKSSISSSVASIDTKDLKQSPVANLSNALVGRLPGIIAVQRSGEPGADGAELLIRGRSTTGNNNPLVLVDGIPRSFSQINATEIETLTVLKDAAAAAQYGARAANGVILITTRRGTSGKPTITYDGNFGFQNSTRLPQYADAATYARLFNQARTNNGDPEQFTAAEIELFANGTDPNNYPNTDWFEETLSKSTPQQNQTLSLTGGSERLKYFVNLGYLSQDGLVEATKFNRYNFRTNLDAQITDDLSIGLNLAGRSEQRDFPGTSASTYFSSLLRIAPIYPAYYSNGLLAPGLNGSNPIGQTTSGYSEGTNETLETVLTATYKIPFVEGLSVKAYGSYDRNYSNGKNWGEPYTYHQLLDNGEFEERQQGNVITLSENFSKGQNILLNGQLNYNRTFGIHDIGFQAIAEQQEQSGNNFNAFRNNFLTTTIDQLFAGDAESQTNNGGAFESARRGFIGRVTYGYDNKIFLEGNVRRDGSDIFAEKGRWGTFPSFSAAYRLSEEAFWQPLKSVISDFKVRASWGQLGNDRVGRFRYLSAFNLGTGYVFGGTNPTVVRGVSPTGLPNPDITWETATQINLGFDVEMFAGALGFELDFFKKNTTNILASRNLAIPGTFGAGLPLENLGEVENKGFEFTTNLRHSFGKFDAFLRGNVTNARNKIIFVDEPEEVEDNLRRTGREIGQNFGLEADGLFQSQAEIDEHADQRSAVAPGDIKYVDQNGDGVIDGEDRIPIGNSDVPRWIYGLTLGFNIGNLDVSTLFQGAGGFSVYLQQEAAFAFFNGGKALEDHTDSWTPDNPGASYPRLLLTSTNNERYSSYWMNDASYVRWKTVEIGYTLPSDVLSSVGVQNLRVFASALNIATFTTERLKNFDPEAPSGRGWFYPQQRIINFGISLSL